MKAFFFSTVLLSVALASGAQTHAADPAVKCESGKLKEAGKYASCRLKADAKAVQKNSLPDYSKCDSKFSDKWGKAEAKAEGACPSNGDETIVTDQITQCTTDVATGIGGGPVCTGGGSPAACAAFSAVAPCTACCSANATCQLNCSIADTLNGCLDPSENDLCTQSVNAAGCADECCP